MGEATTFDKEMLLRFLFYHMSQETRQQLRRELPGAYDRYVGQDTATVVRVSDGSPV